MSPCSSGGAGAGGKRSILGSCIARTSSEDDLQHLEEKRPISPGQRGTTWNGEGEIGNERSSSQPRTSSTNVQKRGEGEPLMNQALFILELCKSLRTNAGKISHRKTASCYHLCLRINCYAFPILSAEKGEGEAERERERSVKQEQQQRRQQRTCALSLFLSLFLLSVPEARSQSNCDINRSELTRPKARSQSNCTINCSHSTRPEAISQSNRTINQAIGLI